jgi:hypothetical protein
MRGIGGLLGFLIVLCVIVSVWPWLLAIGGGFAAFVSLVYWCDGRHALRKRVHDALAARADEQQQQVWDGDERGVYGLAWPAVQQYRWVRDSCAVKKLEELEMPITAPPPARARREFHPVEAV